VSNSTENSVLHRRLLFRGGRAGFSSRGRGGFRGRGGGFRGGRRGDNAPVSEADLDAELDQYNQHRDT
jgi:hypothetical protein